MQNYVQKGNTLTVTAPSTLVSGGGCQVGNIFGKHRKASLGEGGRSGGLPGAGRTAKDDGAIADLHRARVQANQTPKAQCETHHRPYEVGASVL